MKILFNTIKFCLLTKAQKRAIAALKKIEAGEADEPVDFLEYLKKEGVWDWQNKNYLNFTESTTGRNGTVLSLSTLLI